MIPSRRNPKRSHGFTLVEIVVVMLILALVIGMAALIVRAISGGQKRSLTAVRIAGVDAALVQFVMLHRRLPCPANGALPSSNTNAGLEDPYWSSAGCTSEANGVVPWRTLGLSEPDASDGWDRRLTYRVWSELAANAPNGMDMSLCDPAGTESPYPTAVTVKHPCNISCSTTNLGQCTPPSYFLVTKGLTIKSIAGTTLMAPAISSDQNQTGAAYVVISAGESGGGAYLSSGQLSASITTDGTEEIKNYASQGYTPGVTYYVDDATSEVAGTSHFDDVVSRPTVFAVISKAGLGPRSH